MSLYHRIHDWTYSDNPEEYINAGPYVDSAAYYVKSVDINSATLVLAVNPKWKGDAPYYGTVELHWFATEDAAILAMLGGECDTYWKYGASFPTSSLALLNSSEKFTTVETPSLKMTYIGFNTISSDVRSDLAFRKAIAYALKYDELVEIGASGYALSANSGFIPNGVPYYKNTAANIYNLATAKLMLDAAGYKYVNGDGIREDTNGSALTVTLLARNKVAGELIKEYLEKARLKVEYKFASDLNAWIELKDAHAYDIAYNGITAKGMMMDSSWATGYFASNTVGAGKLQNVDDPVFLELWAKIATAPDGDEGKREVVGAYLRNQTILHGREVKDAMKRWGTCERKHAHLKKTVKFDVVHCKKNNRALSAIMNFITFQLLMLAHLQNRFQNMNFANYR